MHHLKRKAERYRAKATIVEADAQEDIDVVVIGNDPLAKQTRVQGRNIRAMAVAKDAPHELVAETDSPVKISSKAMIKKSKAKGSTSASSDVNIHFNVTLPSPTSYCSSSLSHPVTSIQRDKAGKDESENKVDRQKLSNIRLDDQVFSQSQEETIKTKIVSYADYNRKIFCKIDLITYLKVEKLDCSYVVLDNEDMSESIFREIVFYKARFNFANLENVKFINADLSEASLQYAQLAGVDFSGSNLSFADISYSKGLRWESFKNAEFTELRVDQKDAWNVHVRSFIFERKRMEKENKKEKKDLENRVIMAERKIKALQERVALLKRREQSKSQPSFYPDFSTSEFTIPQRKKEKRKKINGDHMWDVDSIAHVRLNSSDLLAYNGHAHIWRDKYKFKVADKSNHLPPVVSLEEMAISRRIAEDKAKYELYVGELKASLVALQEKKQQLDSAFNVLVQEAINKKFLDEEAASSMLLGLESALNEEKIESIITDAFFNYAIRNNDSLIVNNFLITPKDKINSLRRENAFCFTIPSEPIELIKKLFAARPSLFSEYKNDVHSLCIAIQNDHLDMIKFFLEDKALVNTSLPGQLTFLHIAARYDRDNIVELLIKYSASVNQKDENNWLPIEIAAYYGSFNVFNLLMREVNKIDKQQKSCEKKDEEDQSINRPIKRIAFFDNSDEEKDEEENELYLLHLACKKGQEKVVKMLLDANAVIDNLDQDDKIPVFIAVEENHPTIVTMLLQAKAMINGVNNQGETLLYVATQKKNQDMVEFLVEKKADINQGTNEKETWQWPTGKGSRPLLSAAYHNHIGIAEFLLRNKAAINQSNGAGETPLYLAAREDHIQMVQFLIEAKAEVVYQIKTAGNEQETAAALRCLIAAKINVNQVRADGWTPLMAAVCWGGDGIAHLLLDAKADPFLPSSQLLRHGDMNQVFQPGSTAFSMAKQIGKTLLPTKMLEYKKENSSSKETLLEETNEFVAQSDFRPTTCSTNSLMSSSIVTRLLSQASGFNSASSSFVGYSSGGNNEENPSLFRYRPISYVSSRSLPAREDVTHHREESISEQSVIEESQILARHKGKVGPSKIDGWDLEDVEAKGNCFYNAVICQLQQINHSFFGEVPKGTLPRDSLRLRIQGRDFKDGEWADDDEIIKLVRAFNCIVAIVDTRHSAKHFTYHYVNKKSEYIHTNIGVDLPILDQPIIQLAFTGNHYLSVTHAPKNSPALGVGSNEKSISEEKTREEDVRNASFTTASALTSPTGPALFRSTTLQKDLESQLCIPKEASKNCGYCNLL